jgi:hypothetical protein
LTILEEIIWLVLDLHFEESMLIHSSTNSTSRQHAICDS